MPHKVPEYFTKQQIDIYIDLTGVDPGFHVGGGAKPLGRGAPTYDFVKFSEKLHEIEKILDRKGGGAPGAPPLNPSLFNLFNVSWFVYCVW